MPMSNGTRAVSRHTQMAVSSNVPPGEFLDCIGFEGDQRNLMPLDPRGDDPRLGSRGIGRGKPEYPRDDRGRPIELRGGPGPAPLKVYLDPTTWEPLVSPVRSRPWGSYFDPKPEDLSQPVWPWQITIGTEAGLNAARRRAPAAEPRPTSGASPSQQHGDAEESDPEAELPRSQWG